MINKKIGFIGCGNMGGAILFGALESGILPKENAYVYDISPAMMEKAEGWGVNLCVDDEDVCAKSDIILLAVKPQNAAEALGMCNKALDGKAMMSIVAGVTVERLQNMIDGTPRILILLPNTPAMVFEGAFAICSDNDFTEEELEIAKSIYSSIGIIEMVPEKLIDARPAASAVAQMKSDRRTVSAVMNSFLFIMIFSFLIGRVDCPLPKPGRDAVEVGLSAGASTN